MSILKIRNEDGTIQEILAIKGEPGPKGDTPIKGIDYWTENDINEIKTYIDEQLGVIENGSY